MKDISPKMLFGSIIAYGLLVLYIYTVREAIVFAQSVPDPGAALSDHNAGLSRTMATVGGLVSALVISQLAISEPGEGLGVLISGDAGAKFLVVIKATYVIVWMGMGAWAFVVGELKLPGKVPELTNFAQGWLGLAVAAGYSYFGLEGYSNPEPKGGNHGSQHPGVEER